MMAIVFATILPCLLLFVGAWLGFQLVRQNDRILVRREAIEKRMAPHRSTGQCHPFLPQPAGSETSQSPQLAA